MELFDATLFESRKRAPIDPVMFIVIAWYAPGSTWKLKDYFTRIESAEKYASGLPDHYTESRIYQIGGKNAPPSRLE